MRTMTQTALALTVAVLAACAEKTPPSSFPVTFSAFSDHEPLGGVTLRLGEEELGETGPDGILHVRLTGKEGDSVAVQADCPEGHRTPEKLPIVTLRRFRGLDPAAEARGVEISIPCPPERRKAVLVVRAEEPNLPVLAQGRLLAQTDESGVAHALVELPPHSTFRMVVDTTGRPKLRPQNPATTLTLRDADEIFVVDQAFTVEQPRRRKRKRRKRKPAATLMPTRLD